MICCLAGILALAMGQGAGTEQTAVYTNEWIGISISHPATWKVAPKKTDAWITIPLKEGAASAGLNVVAASFNADPEIWQLSQKHTNTDMGLEVIRQWQEEILGVPLLLTKVRSGPGMLGSAIKAVPELPADQNLVTLVGLVYSRTPRKLLFRLTAPEGAYDEAESTWRKTLESLRTTSGEIPQPEDPTRKPDPEVQPGAIPAGPPKKTTIGADGKPVATKHQRATQSFEAVAGGRKVGFFYPEGWTVEKAQDGALTLKHSTSPTVLRLGIFSPLDSDPPMRALVKLSAEGLKRFDKVVSREENLPKVNKAGANFVRIWREGVGKEGALWTLEAVAGSPQYYLTLATGGTGKPDAAQRKTLEALIDAVSVEPLE